MHVDPNRPINTRKYRYLTYQMAIDPLQTACCPAYGNISDKVARGFISRIVFWNQGIPVDGSETKGNVVYEGVRSYSVDLANNAVLGTGNPFPAQTGWRGNPTIRQFRIDPTETPAGLPTPFCLIDVQLRGKPVPEADGTFTVRFVTTDPEGDPASVTFFLDTDATGFDGSMLGTAMVPAGTPGGMTLTFSFSTSTLAAGDYFLYAVVTDGAGNTFARYADVPISVGGLSGGVALTLALNQTAVSPGDTLGWT